MVTEDEDKNEENKYGEWCAQRPSALSSFGDGESDNDSHCGGYYYDYQDGMMIRDRDLRDQVFANLCARHLPVANVRFRRHIWRALWKQSRILHRSLCDLRGKRQSGDTSSVDDEPDQLACTAATTAATVIIIGWIIIVIIICCFSYGFLVVGTEWPGGLGILFLPRPPYHPYLLRPP
jgi:hypothetical protein